MISTEKYNRFVGELNEVSEKYGITFNYNPADGMEVKTDFKYIEFEYRNSVIFIKTKATKLHTESTLQYIQELSIAGQLLPKLTKVVHNSLIYMH